MLIPKIKQTLQTIIHIISSLSVHYSKKSQALRIDLYTSLAHAHQELLGYQPKME